MPKTRTSMTLAARSLTCRTRVALAVLLGVCSTAALAQQGGWTVTNLHPQGADASQAWGVSSQTCTGSAQYSHGPNARSTAVLWQNGNSGTWLSLNPAGSDSASARSLAGGQQVGSASVGGRDHAGLWNQTAASWVDLHPAGAMWSSAFGTAGDVQVGTSWFGVEPGHAGLWRGSAASWVDLHPAGATQSSAVAASGNQQVGTAEIGGASHASLWSGTAASWIDLNPPGASESAAYATNGSIQGGSARFGSMHAVIWNGSAESFVDLNPHPHGQDAQSSYVYGMSGTRQVGTAYINGVGHASLWNSTAGSWEDLSLALPDGPSGSETWHHTVATAIWSDGVRTTIAGYGYNLLSLRYKALLWSRESPACAADFNHDGFVDAFDYDAFVEAFESGGMGADFNNDGFADAFDYDDFVTAFETPC